MSERRLLLACISSSLAGILISAIIHSNLSSPSLYSDIYSFWSRSWVSAGQVPFSSSNAFLEYPPLSGALLYAARVIGGFIGGVSGGDYSGYYTGFTLLSLVAAAVLGWSTWRLASALHSPVNPAFFILPTMIVYGVYNFDLFNALFIVLTIQMFVEKRKGWSAGFLGVAVATKLVAGVLLPILLLELTDWKERERYLITSSLVAFAFFVPIMIFNFGYFGQFISFYQHWGLEDAWYIWIFQDQFSSTAKLFGFAVMALLLLRVYTLKMPLVQKCFLALASYLLGAYIYAPQFNVMLIPLLAVMSVDLPALYSLEAFNALIILTWFAYQDPTHVGTVPQVMALLRTASLAWLGLSVSAGSGHSLSGWLLTRLRSRKTPLTLSGGMPVRD